MPVEIRELNIKGSVTSNKSTVVREFEDRNSDLLRSSLLRSLKKDILNECKEYISDELERQNQR